MKKTVLIFLMVLLAWMAINLCCGRFFGGTNWDVTATKRYTSDELLKKLVSEVQEPVLFRVYVSDNLKLYSRESYAYAGYVTDMLKQYQSINPQNIKLEVVKVKPYSNEAKMAESAGIKAIPFRDEYVYLGLQILKGDKQRVISELKSGREVYFENDISRVLTYFMDEEKPIVGIVSLEMSIFEASEKKKNWSLMDELKEKYRFMQVTGDTVYIPQEVKVLMVLDPKELSSTFLYALDQYLMRGGKLIVFVDPYSEIEQFYKGYPPQRRENISSLLQQWGIGYDSGKVVGSFTQAVYVDGGFRYPLWFFVDENGNQKLHFRSSGALEILPHDDRDVKYEILLRSPADAGVIAAESLRYAPKRNIVDRFKGENKIYNLAIRARGRFLSNYKHGLYDGTEYENVMPPFTAMASEEATLVVVADSDFVSDDAWVIESDDENPIYGAVPYADNAMFVVSLIDDLLQEDGSQSIRMKLKRSNHKNIVEVVSEPLSEVYVKKQSELKTKYNLLQEQLREVNALSKIANGAKKIEYRKEVDSLEHSLQKVSNELKRSTSEFERVIARKIKFLLLINLLCPLIILLMIMSLVGWRRKCNLRGKNE